MPDKNFLADNVWLFVLFAGLNKDSMNNQNVKKKTKKELPICLFYYRKSFIEFHVLRSNGISVIQ